ncbi:MAG: putative DNA-binding transcriptional regulator YafY [Gammaproteobacteria bacterium]
MDRTERFHTIDQLLCNQRHVTLAQFLRTLGVSLATFKRDLEYMRDRLAAPIVWDREQNSYCYDQSELGSEAYQLPGLWFNTSEIQALLSMDALLNSLQPGMLSSHIKPLRSRIKMLLDKGDHSVDEISKRIRILPAMAKSISSENFQMISQALLNRRRLVMTYHNRQDDSETNREVSPQRLTHYRDNWYLDSWCHLRNGLRSFSVDAIRQLALSSQPAIDVDETRLNLELESGYGIFSGVETKQAKLRFSPKRARWVCREQWHPKQTSEYDSLGYYILRLPYSNDTELLMDILKYGADVEVLKPKSLRLAVIENIAKLAQLY